ncbi:MAG TPA: hypothetical protein VLI93_15055 [Acetobacteraceae bacterium]|nr:hypothetical protein [Acetobacteraceae bacterium]
MRAERRHHADCYRRPIAKKARLRAVAARYIAEHGLAGFNLHRLAPEAGLNFELARWYYRTNQALIADIVRAHQVALGEAMGEWVLAARRLRGAAGVELLAGALLEALIAGRDGHRTAMAAMAAFPGIAETARRGDLWLHGVFADALQVTAPWLAAGEGDVLARSLLVLLEQWAVRLEQADAANRATCVRLVSAMVLGASAVGAGCVGAPAARLGAGEAPAAGQRRR